MRLRAGTSGFAYREWKGRFYPEKLPASAMLRYYAERFGSVEINSTFYRMPSEGALARWRSDVPTDFKFVLKATRRITHRRRLKEAGEAVAQFFRTASALGDRLGAVLVQLPPNLPKDVSSLESFLALLPEGAQLAFEFRHDSWFDPDVHEALRAHGAVLGMVQSEDHETPLVPTSSWGYLRLRKVAYTDSDLDGWIRRIQALPWEEVYVFFKHEDEGTGPRLAARFTERFLDIDIGSC